MPSVVFGIHITAVLGLAGHRGAIAGRRLGRLRRGEGFQARGAIRRFRKPYNCCPDHGGAIAGRRLGRLRRGEGFQAQGAIRRFRKPYNCCPGPGWPLWRHCWTKTGPTEARRGLSSPRCHPSLWPLGAIAGRRRGRLRRGDFRKPERSVLLWSISECKVPHLRWSQAPPCLGQG